MAKRLADMDHTYKRKLIQRWIGAPQSGDLNDPRTVDELLKDVNGLEAYLIEKEAAAADDVPDAPKTFNEVEHSTPNKGGRIKPLGVVFHHSAGSFAGSLSWIKQRRSKVSYHVLIHPDGTRHNVVPLTRRAWHAGKSKFRGKSGCNGFMVGVAFSGDTNKRGLTDAEIASAAEFVILHADEFGWDVSWMTDHRTVSPGRKDDLHPVQWNRLRNELIRRMQS